MPPSEEMIFDYWSDDTATVVNINAAVTTLRMPSANTSVTAVFKATSTVGDGIPDSWRALHFGGDGSSASSTSAASADPDHDGRSNLEEYEAGTDPNDQASVFKLTLFEMAADWINIDVTSEAFNRYTLQSSETLAQGSWIPESYEVVGDGQPIRFEMQSGAEPRMFFRVENIRETFTAPDGLANP